MEAQQEAQQTEHTTQPKKSRVLTRMRWAWALLMLPLLPRILNDWQDMWSGLRGVIYGISQLLRYFDVYSLSYSMNYMLRYVAFWWLLLLLSRAVVQVKTTPQRWVVPVLAGFLLLWVWPVDVSLYYADFYSLGASGSAITWLGRSFKVIRLVGTALALVLVFARALPKPSSVPAPFESRLWRMWLVGSGCTALAVLLWVYASTFGTTSLTLDDYAGDPIAVWISLIMAYVKPLLLGGLLLAVFRILQKSQQKSTWQFVLYLTLMVHVFYAPLWPSLLRGRSSYIYEMASGEFWWWLLILLPLFVVGAVLNLRVVLQLKERMMGD